MSLTVSVMVLNSVSVISSDFFPDLLGQAVFSAIFGFTFGCYISSVMVVLSLTTASRTTLTTPLGLVLLTAGLSSLAGPILAGALYDLTSSHRFVSLSYVSAQSLTSPPPDWDFSPVEGWPHWGHCFSWLYQRCRNLPIEMLYL